MKTIFIGIRYKNGSWGINDAEVFAVIEAVKLFKEKLRAHVIVEGDSKMKILMLWNRACFFVFGIYFRRAVGSEHITDILFQYVYGNWEHDWGDHCVDRKAAMIITSRFLF